MCFLGYVVYGQASDLLNKPKESHIHFTKGLDMLKALLPENDIRLANGLHIVCFYRFIDHRSFWFSSARILSLSSQARSDFRMVQAIKASS